MTCIWFADSVEKHADEETERRQQASVGPAEEKTGETFRIGINWT